MACLEAPGLGYRSIAASDVRPYGRVNRWNGPNEVDIDAVADVSVPLNAEIDISGTIYGDTDLSKVDVNIFWDDSIEDDDDTADNGPTWNHDYTAGGGAGTYNIVVTITNQYGFCDSLLVEAIVVAA